LAGLIDRLAFHKSEKGFCVGPALLDTIVQQVVPPRGQAAAAFVTMRADPPPAEPQFRLETSRPRTNA